MKDGNKETEERRDKGKRQKRKDRKERQRTETERKRQRKETEKEGQEEIERDRKKETEDRDRKKEGVVSYSLCLWGKNKKLRQPSYKLVYVSKTAQREKLTNETREL